jgi:hypothetical protein
MTWNTPVGLRVLEDAELYLLSRAIEDITLDILESDPGEPFALIGIELFDKLHDAEKIVMLDYVKTYLFEESPAPPPRTATAEATVAAIFEFINNQVTADDQEYKLLLEDTGRLYGWAPEDDELEYDWEEGVELLYNRIQGNSDFELVSLPPEADIELSARFSLLPKDYFTSAALPEPSGYEMVEVIRRLLDVG